MLLNVWRTSLRRNFGIFVKQRGVCIKTSHRAFVCNNFISTNSNGDDNLSDNSSSANEIKEHSEDSSCKSRKTKDFTMTRLRVKRHTSPSTRLQSILPDNFTESLTNASTRSNENTVDRSQTEEGNETVSKISKDFIIMRRGSSVSPSKRLSNLIPEDYWDEVTDTETKQIVDELGAQSESSSDKKKRW